jgi:hypothetical protein
MSMSSNYISGGPPIGHPFWSFCAAPLLLLRVGCQWPHVTILHKTALADPKTAQHDRRPSISQEYFHGLLIDALHENTDILLVPQRTVQRAADDIDNKTTISDYEGSRTTSLMSRAGEEENRRTPHETIVGEN